ncbi:MULTISPECIES: hypothetical protein [Streptomyces]|uniref:hypothetical protein n=1 Tax=Streptomyces TaxID=1883 RepID=UPI00131D2911|nr:MULTISPECIES: hypothetical protein [Streptomyces]
MRNRRLVMSAALVAAGVGLVPGIARAAPGAGPDATRGTGGATYSSPAERTVVTEGPQGAKGKQGAQGAPGKQGAQDASTSIHLTAHTDGARSIELRSHVIDFDAPALDVVVSWGDGTTDTYALPAGGASDARDLKHRYTVLGTYDVKVTAKNAAAGTEAVNELKFTTKGAEFTAHEPTRLLDTRAGVGAAKAKVGPRSSVALKVAGAAKVPAGATAVALNVTVTNTTGAGHVSVQSTKDRAEGAETSNVNFAAGQTVPNLVIEAIGEDGYVHLFNGGWEPVDLIADVTGYFAPAHANGWGALNPTRVVDTREGLGTARGQVPGQGTFGVEIAGRAGVPKGATAVAVNLTATNPRSAGHLTAYPSGKAAPATSNVNFTAGQTVANSAVVPIGPDGKINVRNGGWDPADVVVDVVGYYTPESRSALVAHGIPLRLLDTRKDGWGWKAGPLKARTHFPMQLEADTTTPDVDGWVLNTTVTDTRGNGFLSVTPDPNFWSDYVNGTAVTPQRPVSSVLNWTKGATVANVAQTPGGKGGMIDLWNQGWEDTHLLVDLLAYYKTD